MSLSTQPTTAHPLTAKTWEEKTNTKQQQLSSFLSIYTSIPILSLFWQLIFSPSHPMVHLGTFLSPFHTSFFRSLIMQLLESLSSSPLSLFNFLELCILYLISLVLLEVKLVLSNFQIETFNEIFIYIAHPLGCATMASIIYRSSGFCLTQIWNQ